jgi:hypothetical protein
MPTLSQGPDSRDLKNRLEKSRTMTLFITIAVYLAESIQGPWKL